MWVPGIKVRLPGLAANTLIILRTISLTLTLCFEMNYTLCHFLRQGNVADTINMQVADLNVILEHTSDCSLGQMTGNSHRT